MKRKIALFITAAAPLTTALLVAGCGGSASSSPYSSRPYGTAVTASAPNGAARVGVANSPLGRVVFDSNGRTLCLFEKDKNRRSARYGQCATYWPPLLTHGKRVARAGVKRLLLGTTPRANASEQVTYAGHLLYPFVEDRKAGQTQGQGSKAFGAGWDVLSPAGNEIESDGERADSLTTGESLSAPTRELAEPLSGAVEALLPSHAEIDGVELSVRDPATGASFHIEVAPANAIDAFYHPYASRRGARTPTASTETRQR